jgi:hypothetical protein
MPNWKDIKEAREERRQEEAYKREMRYMAEDLFGDPAEQQPEPQRFDGRKKDMQNFMLGILGPSIDAAAEAKESGSTDAAALQKEQDAFLEQQAVLQEQRMERDIQAGLYQGSPLAQMTVGERQEMYRQNAAAREQERWERDQAAKQRVKRRQAEREAMAQRWEAEDRYGL